MWLDFNGFAIDKEQNNKITSIKILNAIGTREKEFIEFAGILRYFLNKNSFDNEMLELTGFTNQKRTIADEKLMMFTETYEVVLRTAPHNHKRYLEIETQNCYWYADSSINKEQGYDIEKLKGYLDIKIPNIFSHQKAQVPEIRVQIWLEALNKYHV